MTKEQLKNAAEAFILRSGIPRDKSGAWMNIEMAMFASSKHMDDAAGRALRDLANAIGLIRLDETTKMKLFRDSTKGEKL